MRRFADDGDRGSMMLAMLLLMVTVALGSLLLATTLGQAKAVRHDQQFTQVLPAGDAGIQRGLFILNNGGPGGLPATSSPLTLGAQTADWFASTQTNVGAPLSYILTSATRSPKRTLIAEAYQSKRFSVAAFADTSVVMRGGNSSGSYNSANNSTAATTNGRIGSNGSVTINGNATADGVDLYNWKADANPSRCSGSPCATRLTTYDDKWDISSPASYAFITSALNGCASQPVFQTSTSATRSLPSGVSCASSLVLDANTTITGPTVIYVSGNVTVSAHLNINYAAGVTPVPANLQIYALGQSVDMSNHSTLAAALYAPLALCSGGAQSVIYGAIVCGSISSVGGWQFHYDDALGAVGAGDFRLRHYREQ